jgi:hypothetical protein
MPSAETPEELAKRAKFVFHGRIRKLKASNMRVAPVSDQTAIVTVVDIVHAPPALEHYVGQDITVEMSEPGHHAGDELLFFANGWLFGEGVAVESIAEEGTEHARKLAVLDSAAPSERLGQRELEERVDDSDLVVEGRVSSVRLPGKPSGAAAAAAATRTRPLSEHDPQWREAVIDVSDVHKGAHKGKQLVVTFPASEDVRWYRAPKFTPGQRGIWMLKRGPEPGGPAEGVRAAAAEGPRYYALHPLDFAPAPEADQARTLARAVGRGTGRRPNR